MRYPGFLKEHGMIGFVAPSFGLADDFRRAGFAHAQERFLEDGYRIKLGPNCHEERGIGISNTPEKCGQELTDFYCNPDIDVLISCAGGELMCETISCLDLERIREAEPKWFMGYSDNTNFTFLLTTMFDTAAIYGPNARSFGMEPRHQAISDALGLLTGELREVRGYDKWQRERNPEEEVNPLAGYLLTEERVLKLWIPEDDWIPDCRLWNGELSMSGRLIGGCMDCLVNLLGTRFDGVETFLEKYREDGFLWFLESCDLSVLSIRRAMWQMEESGWFRNVKGFLIGRPLCYGQEMMGLDAYEAVLGIARRHHVPVVMDMDLGHLPPAMPIVCGSVGHVDIQGNRMRIQYEYR